MMPQLGYLVHVEKPRLCHAWCPHVGVVWGAPEGIPQQRCLSAIAETTAEMLRLRCPAQWQQPGQGTSMGAGWDGPVPWLDAPEVRVSLCPHGDTQAGMSLCPSRDAPIPRWSGDVWDALVGMPWWGCIGAVPVP